MKALIVDDERLARTELKRLLNPFKDIKVVGEAVNADDAIEKIDQLKPDLLFLDIQMPGKSGFELLEELDTVPTLYWLRRVVKKVRQSLIDQYLQNRTRFLLKMESVAGL